MRKGLGRLKGMGLGFTGLCLGLGLLSPCLALTKQPPIGLKGCPREVEELAAWMLPDLPGYANRVMQRSQSPGSRQNFVILVGKPEFEPLPVPSRQFTPALAEQKSVRQVFFTTLEHQYGSRQQARLQNFYWLLLTQTDEGWRLVTLLTQLASLHPGDPPLPPVEVADGVMGQAIQLWLRDCRTGSLLIQRR